MSVRLWAASAFLILGVVAACIVATPAPSPTPAPQLHHASAAPTATAWPTSRASARPSAAPEPSLSGPLNLDFGVVDQAWLKPMLKFASDGQSVIFSSGVADGPEGEFAPDLWRHTPGEATPELLWRNPQRDRSLVLIAGASVSDEEGVWAFVDMPLDGSRDWNLWLLTQPGGAALLLDTHPGDEDVPAAVPSFDVAVEAWSEVAWTAFDAGPAGPGCPPGTVKHHA